MEAPLIVKYRGDGEDGGGSGVMIGVAMIVDVGGGDNGENEGDVGDGAWDGGDGWGDSGDGGDHKWGMGYDGEVWGMMGSIAM